MIFQVRKADSETAPEATRKLFGLGLFGGGGGGAQWGGVARTWRHTYDAMSSQQRVRKLRPVAPIRKFEFLFYFFPPSPSHSVVRVASCCNGSGSGSGSKLVNNCDISALGMTGLDF